MAKSSKLGSGDQSNSTVGAVSKCPIATGDIDIMSPRQAQAYCTKRADEIRNEIAKVLDDGKSKENGDYLQADKITVAIAIVENSKGVRRVVITCSRSPDGTLPPKVRHVVNEPQETNPSTRPLIRERTYEGKKQLVEVDPETNEIIGPYKKGTKRNKYEGHTRNHGEQRLKNGGALKPDEKIVGMSHSNKDGCCKKCKIVFGDELAKIDPERR